MPMLSSRREFARESRCLIDRVEPWCKNSVANQSCEHIRAPRLIGGSVKMMMRPVVRFTNYFAAAILIFLFGFLSIAKAAEVNPLRPIDASSPKATLEGFVETMDETYRGMADLLK